MKHILWLAVRCCLHTERASLGFIPGLGRVCPPSSFVYVGSLQVLQLPPAGHVGLKLNSGFKLPIGLNVNVCGCSSLYVSSVINW